MPEEKVVEIDGTQYLVRCDAEICDIMKGHELSRWKVAENVIDPKCKSCKHFHMIGFSL